MTGQKKLEDLKKTDKKQIIVRKTVDASVKLKVSKQKEHFIMKFKKVLVIPALALAATCFLTACGTKKDSKKEEVKEIKMSDIKDDAVSKKTKVVDGEEVTEYTTKDGNVIQIPAGNEEGMESKDAGGSGAPAKN
ncbi:hypothetical protein HMPREF1243_1814 [Streptococcus pyogenes GA03747]|nr:hypothetical protein [Streptococcus pyogenes]ESU94850.1 hypothetical protein HMPREF1243_1814 [Streptococcus pyogenes GA03747]